MPTFYPVRACLPSPAAAGASRPKVDSAVPARGEKNKNLGMFAARFCRPHGEPTETPFFGPWPDL